jgi:hypothetical protein
MFTGLSELTKGLNFYAIVFALVVGVTSVSWDGLTMLKAAMFMPTVAALLMLLVVTRDGFAGAGRASLGLHRAGLRFWPLAVLGLVVVAGAALVRGRPRSRCAAHRCPAPRRRSRTPAAAGSVPTGRLAVGV